MSKKYKTYSVEDKLSLLREYYQSGLSRYQFCKIHGIASSRSLKVWQEKFASEEVSVSLQPDQTDDTDMANRSKEDYQDEVSRLKRRIAELEKALTFSRLETEARDLMITRSEEYFNIPIRKKCGAK